MSMPEAYQAYQQNQIVTLPQEKLVLMLYEGAVKFSRAALEALKDNNLEQSNYNLLRTQDIVAELKNNVDRSQGELAENLFLLYDYVYRRLVEANLHKDPGACQEAAAMLAEFRDAWQQVVERHHSHDFRTRKGLDLRG